MTVGEAKNIARQWVEEQESRMDNFYGAYFSGSFNFKADDEVWEDWSDIDIRIVVDGEVPDGFVHKRFVYQGVLFDPWYDSLDESLTPERLLSDFIKAYHFAVPNVISDPTGNLTRTQKAVAKEYAKTEWIRKRCESARESVVKPLNRCLDEKQDAIGPKDRFWAAYFSIMHTTDIPVLAALAIPTSRRHLVVSREVLDKYGNPQIYKKILGLWGCARTSIEQIKSILESMVKAFDRAIQLVPPQPTTFFEAYLYDICRPYAVGGSRRMIEGGNHREAVPFVLGGFRAAIEAIDKYDLEEKGQYIESYRNAMATLGFTSERVIIERAKKLKAFLPETMEVAEYIIENNPSIIK